MAIAEMPGDARQRRSVRAFDFGKRLGRGDDLDNASVFDRQAVAGAQHHRLRQIEQKGEAFDAGHRDATAIAVVEVEHHRVGGRAGPGAGGANGASSQHGWRNRKA
jgi:hypothetical protein